MRLLRAVASLTVVAGVWMLRPATARAQTMDNMVNTFVLFDQAEYRRTGEANPLRWDMIGWIGGDFTRFWIKTEGTQATVGGGGEAEVQALYSRLIAPFWEWQVGANLETRYGGGASRTRVQAVIGLEGLAPYWFELEPALFVSQNGDISAKVTGTYDLFVTQRLIAQPRIDVRAAIQEVADFGVGSGLNDLELGLRLRYELRREYAPYLGFSWRQTFAGTADLARLQGAPVSDFALVGGLRVWF